MIIIAQQYASKEGSYKHTEYDIWYDVKTKIKAYMLKYVPKIKSDILYYYIFSDHKYIVEFRPN